MLCLTEMLSNGNTKRRRRSAYVGRLKKCLFKVKKKYDEIFIETYDYNEIYCLHKYHFQIKGTKYDVGI